MVSVLRFGHPNCSQPTHHREIPVFLFSVLSVRCQSVVSALSVAQKSVFWQAECLGSAENKGERLPNLQLGRVVVCTAVETVFRRFRVLSVRCQCVVSALSVRCQSVVSALSVRCQWVVSAYKSSF